MFKEIKIRPFISTGNFVTALFYSSILVAVILKQNGGFLLQTFDRRIISEATIAGIEVGSRITLFYQAAFASVISFLFFFLILAFVKDFFEKKVLKQAKEFIFTFESTFFNIMSLFGIITVVLGMSSHTTSTLSLLICLHIVIAGFCVLKGLAIRYSWTRIILYLSNKYFVIWLFINSFVCMFYLGYLGKSIADLQNIPIPLYYIIGFALNFVVFFTVFSFLIKNNKFNEGYAIKLIVISTIPVFISPIYLPLSNEMYLILNQRGIYSISPRKILLLLLSFSAIGSGIIFVLNKRKLPTLLSSSTLANYYYPILLITLTTILYQPPIKIGPPTEMFESGNPGIAVDQFFRYGKIPLLETFNAHALSEIIAPVIYSVLNGYQEWGSSLYNTWFDKLAYVVIGYFFLRKLISNELALLTLMFFPLGVLSVQLLPEYFSVGLVAVFALHRVMKVPSLSNYLLFFFVLFFTFLWRFDLGASVIPAALITQFFYWIIYKGKLEIKNLVFAGLATGVFWFLTYIVLAIVKDIPILFRLKELMAVVSSNQIWGFSTLGDVKKLNFYLFYIIVPAINILLIGYILVKSRFFEKWKAEIFTSISFLLLFTLFNFPRGLVRHSLMENTASFIVGFMALPIMYLPFLISSNRTGINNYVKFSLIGIVYSFIVILGVSGIRINDNSLIGETVERFTAFSDYIATDETIMRYDEPTEYSNQVYTGLKDLFDQTMAPNETFIDFSNAPYLYVHTQRETPMYINQTPAFLSDEASQIAFLEEIQSYSVPYVVFADKSGFLGIDGVPNHIRSYRISEYIYKSYVPFVKVNGFDVWVSKQKKPIIESKLNSLSRSSKEIIVYSPGQNDLSKIERNDIKGLQETKDGLVLETGTVDPYIHNLFSSQELNEIMLADNSEYNLEIEYSTRKGGGAQTYFLLNGHTFKDEESLTTELAESSSVGIQKVNIPFTGTLHDIRIDPPSADIFVVHSIKLQEKPNVYKQLFVSSNEDVEIGWVPFYWGEQDTLNAKETTAVQTKLAQKQKLYPENTKRYIINDSINKENGNYVHLKIRSSQRGKPYKARIEYGDVNSNISGSYTFYIKPDGEYHDYMIRVSSQYNWYRTIVKSLKITAEKETEVQEINIRKGD
ncbi:hypothetical protein [Bacillus sp. V33-4]|uniref:hypothetical protein n=1 Tax=Bacillus sp. V33-4 TaxID=2054169 RepID=UPI000C778D9B|nr:hypothetical protein [Bacillus sp. V33-4]PLR84331.1 hypothetical protein CVD23_11885 [Bacillus sp. V33-4]